MMIGTFSTSKDPSKVHRIVIEATREVKQQLTASSRFPWFFGGRLERGIPGLDAIVVKSDRRTVLYRWSSSSTSGSHSSQISPSAVKVRELKLSS